MIFQSINLSMSNHSFSVSFYSPQFHKMHNKQMAQTSTWVIYSQYSRGGIWAKPSHTAPREPLTHSFRRKSPRFLPWAFLLYSPEASMALCAASSQWPGTFPSCWPSHNPALSNTSYKLMVAELSQKLLTYSGRHSAGCSCSASHSFSLAPSLSI